MAKHILHKAASRNVADHGWLKSAQTFSFAGNYDPDRVHFGALRVLNDDIVDGGRGFGEHPHDNMEIISIPLKGSLKHRDSMGNETVIEPGEIQVMSAGTGIYHTEYNKNENDPVQFLQIWLYPDQRNVTPRYDQKRFSEADAYNKLQQILSPDADDEGVWIHQQAWFTRGNFDSRKTIEYQLHREGNGVYLFVINGEVETAEQLLGARDGIGIWETGSISFKSVTKSEVLLMEVPMVF